jgi:hypothetical protein
MGKVSSLKRLSFENGLIVKSMFALFAATMSGYCSDIDDVCSAQSENVQSSGFQDQPGSPMKCSDLESKLGRVREKYRNSKTENLLLRMRLEACLELIDGYRDIMKRMRQSRPGMFNEEPLDVYTMEKPKY